MNTVSANNPTLSSILTELIKHYNITEAELARAVNLPRATINRIKSGKITDPRSSTLTLLANYFNVSIDQLLGYTPLVLAGNNKISIVPIPIIKWEQLLNMVKKSMSYIIDSKTHQEWTHFEFNSVPEEYSLLALRVEGDAMWPYFDSKSIIVIDKLQEVQNRSFVVAYIADSDEVIFRQILIDGKIKMLTPLNKAFSSRKLEDDDRIIGVVAHAKRSF